MVDLKKQAQQNNNQDKTEKKVDRQQQWRGFQPGEKQKNPKVIPILKYVPPNNFKRFKEAVSKKALLEFGNLGKLINHGTIVLPDLPDRETYLLDKDPDGLNRLEYLEDMKQYRRELAD